MIHSHASKSRYSAIEDSIFCIHEEKRAHKQLVSKTIQIGNAVLEYPIRMLDMALGRNLAFERAPSTLTVL